METDTAGQSIDLYSRILDSSIKRAFQNSEDFKKNIIIHVEIVNGGVVISSIEFTESAKLDDYTSIESIDVDKLRYLDILMTPTKEDINFFFKAAATQTFAQSDDEDFKFDDDENVLRVKIFFNSDIEIMKKMQGELENLLNKMFKPNAATTITTVTESNTNIFLEDTYYNDYISNFLRVINGILRIPLIYKLLTLTSADYESLFNGQNPAALNNFKNGLVNLLNINFNKTISVDGLTDVDILKYTQHLSTKKSNPEQLIYILNIISKEIERLAYDIKHKLSIMIIIAIHHYLVNTVDPFWKKYISLNDMLNNKNRTKHFIEFESSLNAKLEEKSKTSVITYLKIRNDTQVDRVYNKSRFRIFLDSQPKKSRMLLYYNDDNYEYKKYNTTPDPTAPVAENVTTPTETYTQQYMFGGFTDIFLPVETNMDIASRMGDIIVKLQTGSPVFILGYGASGAGKTSSLIYYKNANEPTNKDGVLVHLCNKMAKSGYTKIEVQCVEYYYKNGDGDGDGDGSKKEEEVSKESEVFTFKYNNTGFILENEMTHSTVHEYRLKNMKKTKNTKTDQTTFKNGTPLGELIIHLVDTDRLVKATTNNPNSSRSHTLVFIKLTKTGETVANLVVGDFAGVENVFDCNNLTVLEKFLTMNRVDNGSYVNNTPFYSTNIEVSDQGYVIIDPIDTASATANSGILNNPEIKTYLESKDPIYDFDKPVIRVNFPQPIMTAFNNKQTIFRELLKFIRKFLDSKRTTFKSSDDINVDTDEITHLYKEANKKTVTGFLDDIEKIIGFANEENRKISIREILGRKYKVDYNAELGCMGKLIEIIDKNFDFYMTSVEYFFKLLNLSKLNIRATLEQNYANIKNKKNTKNIVLDTLFSDALGVVWNTMLISRGEITEMIKNAWTEFAKKFNSSTKILLNASHDNSHTNLSPTPLVIYYTARITKWFKEQIVNEIRALLEEKEFNYCSEQFISDFKRRELKMSLEQMIDMYFNVYKLNKLKQQRLNLIINELIEKVYNGDELKKEYKLELTELTESANPETDVSIATVIDDIKTLLGVKLKSKLLNFLEIEDEVSKSWNGLQAITQYFLTRPEFTDNIFEARNSWFNDLWETMKNMELETVFRNYAIKKVCENRVIEGKFINDSLFVARETIKQILREKTAGNKISPLFVDECFEQYCQNGEYCFADEEEEKKRIENEITGLSKNSSVSQQIVATSQVIKSNQQFTNIFNKIYAKLYAQDSESAQTTISDMYKKIIVSVFCVFNISPVANNPPPVPYIDINRLKYIYKYLIKIGRYTDASIEELKKEIRTILAKINNNPRLSDLKTTTILRVDNIHTSLHKVTILEGITFLIDTSNQISYKLDNTRELIQQFIELIDRSNAISAIGTLEFLDQLAKFNTVTNICRVDDHYLSNAMSEPLNNGFEELYSDV